MDAQKKLVTYAKLPQLGERLRAEGRSIVLVPGVWDNLHRGHIAHLEFCKGLLSNQNHALVVVVGGDKVTQEDKGPDRPSILASDRASLVADIPFVDYVVINEETGIGSRTCREIVRRLRPNYMVVCVPDDRHLANKQWLCRVWGVTFIPCLREPPEGDEEISTTQLLGI